MSEGTFDFAKAKTRDDGRKTLFKPTGTAPSLDLLHDLSACRHKKLIVDAKARTIVCSACGAMVDPFDAMLMTCRRERRMQMEYDTIMQERKHQRGFYAKKKTMKAKRCKHTHTAQLANGQRKCLSCDTVLDAEPAGELK